MTIPNILSLTRLFLSLPIAFTLLNNYRTVGLILILIAWVTDLLDGYLARRLNVISELGKVLDPLADKTLIFIIVLCLILDNTLTLVTAIIVVLRDISILLAGLIVLKRYKFAIPSNWVGKISAFLIGSSLFVMLLKQNPVVNIYLEKFIIFVAIVSIFLYSFYYFKWVKKLRSS